MRTKPKPWYPPAEKIAEIFRDVQKAVEEQLKLEQYVTTEIVHIMPCRCGNCDGQSWVRLLSETRLSMFPVEWLLNTTKGRATLMECIVEIYRDMGGVFVMASTGRGEVFPAESKVPSLEEFAATCDDCDRYAVISVRGAAECIFGYGKVTDSGDSVDGDWVVVSGKDARGMWGDLDMHDAAVAEKDAAWRCRN